MTHYSKEEIESLIERFEKRILPKVEWTHEAHLAIAIWYVSKYSFNEALNLVRDNITRHNESVGTPNTDYKGYHETITRFWLMVAHRFLSDKNKSDITANCNKLIVSEKGISNYPLLYYNGITLFSVKARHEWVEPDLKPFH